MVHIATIGTSFITEEFLAGAAAVEGLSLGAVYSRSLEKGEALARRFGAQQVYTDLEALAGAEIDAVYIASPNSLHFAQCEMFLKRDKHILCEKPVTLTPEELFSLQSLAKQRNLVFAEAIMMMYSPARNVVKNALKSLGKITSAHFDFSQLSSRYELLKRGEMPNIFNRKMGGGCLMDLGCYCVYPAVEFFGIPARVFASAVLLDDGTDSNGSAVFEYPEKQVTMTYAKSGQDRAGSQIIGDEGTLHIGSISKLTDITFYYKDNSKEVLVGDTPKQEIMGCEAAAFHAFITNPDATRELYESASSNALAVSLLMAEMRRQSGIKIG